MSRTLPHLATLHRHLPRAYSQTSRGFKVVRTDSEQAVPSLVARLHERATVVELPEFGTSEAKLIDTCRDAHVILHCYTPITRAVFQAAPELRGIVKYGVGIDAIDIEAAKEHGVAVANIPEYGEETVAEGAFTLMIGLHKKLKRVQNAMRSGGWAWPSEEMLGSDLAGQTLGMVGNGRIGRCMARMARGFRMRLMAYDPYVDAQDMADQGICKVDSLSELCQTADTVSIHTVLNHETRGMIGHELLTSMKPTAMLVNVSRGPIVDEAALVDAVLSGQIGGVGLDVFSGEPLTLDGHLMSALMHNDNVLMTPHLAFWTKEARERLMDEALERCLELLDGQPLTVLSKDPRLTSQCNNVRHGGFSTASGRYVV